jgi:hypothetical protein
MAKRYIKITPFADRPSTLGPLSAARLNAMNDGLEAMDTYKIDMDHIADNLVTDDPTFVLSAKQGKLLNDNLANKVATTQHLRILHGSGSFSVGAGGDFIILHNGSFTSDTSYAFFAVMAVAGSNRVTTTNSGTNSCYCTANRYDGELLPAGTILYLSWIAIGY